MGKERGKVNPERVRQRFSREFKLEAVRLLEQGGKPATQLAMGRTTSNNKGQTTVPDARMKVNGVRRK